MVDNVPAHEQLPPTLQLDLTPDEVVYLVGVVMGTRSVARSNLLDKLSTTARTYWQNKLDMCDNLIRKLTNQSEQ